MTRVRKGSSTVLRPLGRPEPVRVRTDASHRPLAIAEGVRVHPVIQHRESWRIDDEWWRRPISRVYWEVILESGRILTLYRDLNRDRWYLQ
jgi:hypothetical protein